MRHQKQGRKLASDASHQKAMLNTMAGQMFEHGRIRTTEAKAKELRRVVDNLITLGKRGDVHARRRALGRIGGRELVHKLFTEVAEKYADRHGGYTRIIKLGPRLGDGAPIVIIELV
ncbi:MAG: 50S ribosomal protein L17 [Actinomycetota bacterium]|nr:50S ribosomal protein L17 [Actinomycetota bacterium]